VGLPGVCGRIDDEDDEDDDDDSDVETEAGRQFASTPL